MNQTKIVRPPSPFEELPHPSLFLAGSIEMAMAEDWQAKAEALAVRLGWWVLNPRRSDWNPSWSQNIENKVFREQVEWELGGLEQSDAIVFYLANRTKSSIALFELGLFGQKASPMVAVVCGDMFWRRGNVEIVCRRYHMPMFETVPLAIGDLTARYRAGTRRSLVDG